MSPTALNLIKPLFILGFALPYVQLALTSRYVEYFYLVVEGSTVFSVSVVPSILGILSLILYLGKPLYWSRRWYSDIFTSAIVSLTILPSLLFIASVILFRDLFDISAKMYLAGVAVTIVILPWLVLMGQVEAIAKLKESVILPAMGTLIAYGIVALLISSGPTKAEKTLDLPTLGSNILQQIGASIVVMVSFLAHARLVPSSQNEPALELGPERIWLGAIFVIASVLYFYLRLYNPKDEQPDPTRPLKAAPRSFAGVGLTVLAAVLINLIILSVDNAVAVSLRPIINLSLIGALIILVFAVPKS